MAILYFYDWAEAVAAVEYWQSLFALVFYHFYEWVVTLNYISTVAEWKPLSLHWVAWWHWKRPLTFSSQYHGIFRWHFHFKGLIATKCSYFLFFFIFINPFAQLSLLWWMPNSGQQRFWNCYDNRPIKTTVGFSFDETVMSSRRKRQCLFFSPLFCRAVIFQNSCATHATSYAFTQPRFIVREKRKEAAVERHW